MFRKRLVLGVAALVLTLAATPGAAFAGSNDNANARVSGVQGESPSDGCDMNSGYFCLYTKIYGGGTMFKLYYCQEYDLSNWNGIGSFFNGNTDGRHALLQDRNYRTIYDSAPAFNEYGTYYEGIYDFNPVWHINAC
jgi:hypothetical protein